MQKVIQALCDHKESRLFKHPNKLLRIKECINCGKELETESCSYGTVTYGTPPTEEELNNDALLMCSGEAYLFTTPAGMTVLSSDKNRPRTYRFIKKVL